MKTNGPKFTLKVSCFSCVHEQSVSYAVQGDSGSVVYCRHPEAPRKPEDDRARIGDTTWQTPAWCPLLAAAKAEFFKGEAGHG